MDFRNIKYGHVIPAESYCDQPYVVKTKEGKWLCVMTTGAGEEGEKGQHIRSCISSDQGKTWEHMVEIEPALPDLGFEASWATPLITPGGRIYVFYTYNKDNIREVISDISEYSWRVDSMGEFCYKYSDDGGLSWSKDRYYISVRKTDIDYENPYGGKVLLFWSVAKPVIEQGNMYLAFSKVGRIGEGFFSLSQGFVLKSDNILTETDPKKINFITLPEGNVGMTAPIGPIAEEHNLTTLSDGSIYCTYRSIDGYLCAAYSRDGGKTFCEMGYATYTPNGKRIKHPRAAGFVRKLENGRFILWYHNHGGGSFGDWDFVKAFGKGINTGEEQWTNYKGRNPVWMSVGKEIDGYVHWSQPEIILYDEEESVRISYPDFIEDNGELYITETQKTIARVHKIHKQILVGMQEQGEKAFLSKDEIIFEGKVWNENIKLDKNFSIEIWLEKNEPQTIINTISMSGEGIKVSVTDDLAIEFLCSDGKRITGFCSDGGVKEHAVINFDYDAGVITFVIDGVLSDGGDKRQYGYGYIDKKISDINGVGCYTENVKLLRVYNRTLATSESIASFLYGGAL